jgi:hypothetical protein
MLTIKSIFRSFSILLVIVFLLGNVPAQAKAVPSVLRFSSNGHILGFAPQNMYVTSQSHALRVDFVSANNIQPYANSSTTKNSKAAPLDNITYKNLWDGISLTYSANEDSIYMTTYTLAPGADIRKIRLHYNMPLTLKPDGTLNMTFETGTLIESAPIAWQDIHGKRVPVKVSFRLKNNEMGFALSTYDPNYELTIDPRLAWNTFLGGNGHDSILAIAVDESGNMYVTGYSSAAWGNPVRSYAGAGDAFVAKLDSSGALLWNTFLGGGVGFTELGNGIAIDENGNVFATGYSYSTWGNPVMAFNTGAATNAFVAKLNTTSGELIWNTFFAENGQGTDIAVDGNGNTYISGISDETWGNPVLSYMGEVDAFVAKLDSSGMLTWNTFLGSGGYDTGAAITRDSSGIYISGQSAGTWGSPTHAHTDSSDAFIAKLDSSSGTLTWNTFLGVGDDSDVSQDITLDGNGSIYTTGSSYGSWDNPVRAYTNGTDAFVAKLDISSGTLIWNTFLGGSALDEGRGIVVDREGNIDVTGYSNTAWGNPVDAYHGGYDAFVAQLNSFGILKWNTFIGGDISPTPGGSDWGNGIAVDTVENIYIAGDSNATWGNPLTPFTGDALDKDAFVVKILGLPTTLSSMPANITPSNATNIDFNVTFSEAMTGVDASDFSLTTTGNITETSITNVTGGPTTYTITVDTGFGNGTIRLDVIDDDTVINQESIPLGGVNAMNGNFTSGETSTIDKISPSVLSSIRTNTNPSSANNINFTVAFSEPVNYVDAADFNLITAGVIGASITNISGSGTTYTITVNTGSGNGTIRLNVIDNDTIMDAALNLLGEIGAGNGTFTSGEVYTINKILTINSIAGQDGWILESAENSNAGSTINTIATTFLLGDNVGNKQYRSILSFNTSILPDTAVITEMTLKIKKHSVVGGGDPIAIFQGILIEFKTGFFGIQKELQPSDFHVNAHKILGPANPSLVNGFYNIFLNGGKNYVNKLTTNSGLTQIRLRFKLDDNNNAVANYLSLYSGNAAVADRPQLVITYYVP